MGQCAANVEPRCSQCIMIKFEASFCSPRISYEMGLRNMHTPEHCTHKHPLTMPAFNITSVDSRIDVADLHIVILTCSMLFWRKFSVCLISDDRSASRIVLSSKNMDVRAILDCTVKRTAKGHTLHISGIQDLLPAWLARVAIAIMRLEACCPWLPEPKLLPELVLYRRSVLYRISKAHLKGI